MVTKNEELIGRIQELLREFKISAWLFYDFRGTDPLAYRILGLDKKSHTTRRWFYIIPADGSPRKLVHRIESKKLDSLPGNKTVYKTWRQLTDGVAEMLDGVSTVAMQYSPNNSIPYISMVDGGTLEFIRSLGPEVVSSADILQRFEAVFTERQALQHRTAATIITGIVKEAFQTAQRLIREHGQTHEFEIQEFIGRRFEEEGLETDFPAIVAVNGNSGDPHYAPTKESSRPIKAGDFLLIDLWAKVKEPDSVFADITWTGYFGETVPDQVLEVFRVVTAARDRGVAFIEQRYAEGRAVCGWEVDDQVRKVIEDAGYGEYFVHRTGHNLGLETHGNGAHLDNFETHDERQLIPGTACTIEPGVYLDAFGVRSELNLFLTESGPEVTTPPQRELLVLPI